MAQTPDQMDAVILEAYDGPASLRLARRAVPRPGPGQVLVKIAASPINPSDIAFIHGSYGFKSAPPVVPGGEGAGTVVAAGSIDVTGSVGDLLSGQAGLTVTVNGIMAAVDPGIGTNGTFEVLGVPLALGANVIEAVAAVALGNTRSAVIVVARIRMRVTVPVISPIVTVSPTRMGRSRRIMIPAMKLAKIS